MMIENQHASAAAKRILLDGQLLEITETTVMKLAYNYEWARRMSQEIALILAGQTVKYLDIGIRERGFSHAAFYGAHGFGRDFTWEIATKSGIFPINESVKVTRLDSITDAALTGTITDNQIVPPLTVTHDVIFVGEYSTLMRGSNADTLLANMRSLLENGAYNRRLIKATAAQIQTGVPIQIFKQSTLEALNCAMKIPNIPTLNHRKEDPSTIAWNLAVAIYYKANHFPWRVGGLKSGSCYVGISFFYDQTTHNRNMFASLAQIFTDTGEGMIVRGDSFNWDTKQKGQPHLTEHSAQNLLESALELYKRHHDDQPPNRFVIHKTSRYTKEEVKGFQNASTDVPRYDYITLSGGREVFFYRNGEHPVLRGTFIPLFDNSCLIYTSGYVDYLKSYYGPRIPKPLEISQHFGDTSLKELAMEIMSLTRLDWNTSKFSLSKPITLKFAERVGKVLGLVPQGEKIQHQYRFYM